MNDRTWPPTFRAWVSAIYTCWKRRGHHWAPDTTALTDWTCVDCGRKTDGWPGSPPERTIWKLEKEPRA